MASWQDEAEIRRILETQERKIGAFFNLAIQEYLDDMGIGKVVSLLERGRVREALDAIEQIAAATANASQAAFLAAAEATSQYLQAGKTMTVGFDQTNARAVAVMQRSRLEFIQGFKDSQTRATQAALVAGIEEGIGPRAMARQFRESIGLTERQWQAVRNYRGLLQRVGIDDVPASAEREFRGRKLRDRRHDRKVLRYIREGKSLDKAEIDKMVERYRQNYLRHRSENIARTEALSSTHIGQDSAINEAIDNRAVEKDRILQRWNTAQDGRQRDAHQELHRTSTPWGEPWVNEIGPIMYPGDRSAAPGNIINCRCARTIRIR